MSPWWLRPPADAEPPGPDSQVPAPAPAPASVHDVLAEPVATWSAPQPGVMTPEPAFAEERPSLPPFHTGSLDPEDFGDEDEDADRAGQAIAALPAPAEGAEDELEPVDGEPGEITDPADGGTAVRRRRRRRRRGGAGRSGEAVASVPSPAVATPPAQLAAVPARASRPARPAREEREPEDDEQDFEQPPVLSEASFHQPSYAQEMYLPPMPSRASGADERKIALFCDFENIALGVRDSQIKQFDIHLVIERLLEKGKIIVKRAYADWERYSDHKRALHEAAIELIDIPQKSYSGKNSADIKMVVDAMDLCYNKEHLDTFVVMSGDSDFSPLVSKLKENNKYVIGVGVKNSSSALLVDNCDEFIYYEDVWRDRQGPTPQVAGMSKKQTEAFSLMVDAIVALKRENKDMLWGSMIKQTMQRKKPSFNEGYYGYSTFSELLEDAQRNQVIKLKRDQRAGTYVVTGFARRKTP